MPVAKKMAVTRTFFAIDIGSGQSIFQRAMRIINLDGPLCPLPDPGASMMALQIEQHRKQQMHVDEIKRWCHVPIA